MRPAASAPGGEVAPNVGPLGEVAPPFAPPPFPLPLPLPPPELGGGGGIRLNV